MVLLMKMIIQIVKKLGMHNSLGLVLGFAVFGLGILPVENLHAGDSVVVYSGRAERLIKPVLDHFQDTTGTTVRSPAPLSPMMSAVR